MRALGRLLDAYRATGADLPFGDPTRAHGVAMEGYFWRVTDAPTGRVAIALIGVNHGPRGPWATVGIATSAHGDRPAGLVTHALPGAWADPDALGAGSGSAFVGTGRGVRVDVPGASVALTITDPAVWPHRLAGGSSWFQMVPGLNQYWHPWLLGGRASGIVEIGGDRWELTDAQAYGEKNWGKGGFPDSWWWGQAQGFTDPDACVAFAGGQVSAGVLRTEVTAVVVRLPDGRVLRLGNPVTSPVAARVGDDRWSLRGRSATWRVDVDAHAEPAAATCCRCPSPSSTATPRGPWSTSQETSA